ncbi:putative DNA replication helicase Dna2 [Taphrina deformans PYCC 5710]|uniref:DNA replication ATP-dependent helicase/nuclease n=1 Tax=Taphrina deformans (strain PYCC 5710 / ATCC 11124 / CBS 356.35 / IMI 108563 / JCM 9778 / NBRC 8474) TaxID=1097556 RepID=R4X7T1_TAPDE|nr:putative DNA replication helicase Dna2 [Taphrina deformans PYCC 5710]|eukprot:CCG81248.1 putative DNA replication helicase Dna2 [Taphrina deformans PYCC 5710]
MYKKKLTKSFFDTTDTNPRSRGRPFHHQNKENILETSLATGPKATSISEVTKARLKSFGLTDSRTSHGPKGPETPLVEKKSFILSQTNDEQGPASSQVEERVQWKVSPPPADRQGGSAQKLTINEMFDIYHASQHSSQTPVKRLDPTGNLWSRYDAGEPLPYLDLDLSPAAQKTPRTDAALRRTTSLPTWSTDCRERKRRKLLGAGEGHESSGHVRTMMERVQEALQNRASPMSAIKHVPTNGLELGGRTVQTPNIMSDEFGSDDLDEDFLAQLPELQNTKHNLQAPSVLHRIDLRRNLNIASTEEADTATSPNKSHQPSPRLLPHSVERLDRPATVENEPPAAISHLKDISMSELGADHVATKIIPGSPGQSSNYSIDFDDEALDKVAAVSGSQSRQPEAQTVVVKATTPAEKPIPKALTQEELLEGLDDEMFSDFEEMTVGEDKTMFHVVEVFHEKFQNGKTMSNRPSLNIKDKRGSIKYVKLADAWADMTIVEGDTLRLHGKWQTSNTFTATNAENLVILHPDVLSVLQDRVRATSQLSKPLLYGSMLHAILQEALCAADFSDHYIRQAIDAQISDNMEKLFLIEESIEAAKDYMYSKVLLLQQWAETFHGEDKWGRVEPMRGREKSHAVAVGVRRALDIEERFWSPTFGMKGNIDVTAEIQVAIDDEKSIVTAPLEFKTGKTSYQQSSHRAQVLLYTLMMSERYQIDVTAGFLYYLETRQITRVAVLHNEIRSLVLMRNELARHMKNKTIPPMIHNKRLCQSCYASEACFTYAKAQDTIKDMPSDFEELFNSKTSHLGERDLAFYNKWETLITKEEGEMFQYRNELWHMTSQEREAVSRCFGDLQIIDGSESFDSKANKMHRWTYELSRAASSTPLSQSSLGDREPIIVSDEEGRYAISCGFVLQVHADKIAVQLDRPLRASRTKLKDFEEVTNQLFTGTQRAASMPNTVRYRVDRDEFKNGMGMVRNNLIALLLDTSSKNASPSTSRQRELIVDLVPPKFGDSVIGRLTGTQTSESLNVDQLKAMNKIMSAKDYALILGMPGTGKTTTIARIIRSLVAAGQSVLLTSYTHSAVDTILLKLAAYDISVLRLGGHSKIHPEVAKFANTERHDCKTFEELNDYYNRPSVVATTCLSINHAIFEQRRFDYCIFDEASQATLPVCLGPLRFADKFVLVGDHYQLPPLVKDAEARKQGLDISLFKMLCEAHPSAVVELQHQYRMNADIMSISNELIYNHRLTCGTKELETKTLDNIHLKHLESFHDQDSSCHANCWLEHVIDPKRSVVYLNTDGIADARESRTSDHIINLAESAIVADLVNGLLLSGMRDLDIGVISPYRSQLRQIQRDLRAHPSVTVDTADRFQGRDRDCIIVSLVRSNEGGTIGELLRDWRRINVAFTRARCKMIILGSQETLAHDRLLNAFLHLVHRRGWAYDLPHDALTCHVPSEESRRVPDSESVKVGERGRREVKVTTAGRRVVLQNRPILRDLMNAL